MTTAPGVAAGPGRLFVATVAFLTLVDLFAAQAIVAPLARAHGVGPGAMGAAVNAATLGMAAASLGAALFAGGLDRRKGVTVALALLAAPTAALGFAPDLASFAALRVAQGLCMATAFALTLTALGELLGGAAAAGAFAAYVAGNVASNLFGRFVAASAVEAVGLPGTFLLFAGLNLAGAALVWFSGHHAPGMTGAAAGASLDALRRHLGAPALRAAFALGFCILFAFIGVFTYVGFMLTSPPLSLPMGAVGLAFLAFAPSLLTTPLAGPCVARLGAGAAAQIGLGIAALGLPLLLAPSVPAALAGMAAVASGTFFAQAAATGFVGRAASLDRAAASGLYLAAYFAGGLVGAIALGRLFETVGWAACVAGAGAALAAGAIAAGRLRSC